MPALDSAVWQNEQGDIGFLESLPQSGLAEHEGHSHLPSGATNPGPAAEPNPNAVVGQGGSRPPAAAPEWAASPALASAGLNTGPSSAPETEPANSSGRSLDNVAPSAKRGKRRQSGTAAALTSTGSQSAGETTSRAAAGDILGPDSGSTDGAQAGSTNAGRNKRRIQPTIIPTSLASKRPAASKQSSAQTASVAARNKLSPSAAASTPSPVAPTTPILAPSSVPKTPVSVPAEHVERRYDEAEEVNMSGDEQDEEAHASERNRLRPSEPEQRHSLSAGNGHAAALAGLLTPRRTHPSSSSTSATQQQPRKSWVVGMFWLLFF